jgi:hypothetical protein
METIKLIVSFISGGLAGAIVNNVVANHKNKIQKLECCYIDDDIISKLPIEFGETKHDNLHSKSFVITNTTNKDISEIKVIFEFEPTAVVTNWVSYSKAGTNIPKGKVYSKRNECQFLIKHFNRNEKVEITLEIANISEDKFNVTELNITGVKVVFKDKRKAKAARPVKMVEKRELKAGS